MNVVHRQKHESIPKCIGCCMFSANIARKPMTLATIDCTPNTVAIYTMPKESNVMRSKALKQTPMHTFIAMNIKGNILLSTGTPIATAARRHEPMKPPMIKGLAR